MAASVFHRICVAVKPDITEHSVNEKNVASPPGHRAIWSHIECPTRRQRRHLADCGDGGDVQNTRLCTGQFTGHISDRSVYEAAFS
ncbi:hypothetical protein LSAT2_021193 [Lamellibrachia satsuma]|nr:hypothetical protein LSAT2_021193 [Lamellibrachia satsuma]